MQAGLGEGEGAHVEVRIGVWSLAAGCQGYPQLRQDK